MELEDTSSNYFSQGFSCAQSVLMAYAERFGLTPELAARLAASFGGGMARTGQTCGAVSGALMVIGLQAGATDPTDKESKERTYALANQLMEAFSAKHGSVNCPGLLNGCHMGTPEGMAAARAEGYFQTRCPVYVRDAARLAGEMIK